jgi:hypothetical protein
MINGGKGLRRVALVALISLNADTGSTEEFHPFCIRPVVPRCTTFAEIFVSADKVASCRQEITRYVKSVLTYRDCLIRDSVQEVRRANEVLDQFNCSVAARHKC